MFRFEFYEGIVRSSFGKYITSGLLTDASDAIKEFIHEVVWEATGNGDGGERQRVTMAYNKLWQSVAVCYS